MVVEEMPEYPGGMKKCLEFLMKNVKYPANARKTGVEGRVIVQYVVDKNGSISNPFVVHPVSPELDAEALRMIKLMPKWKPGRQRGVNVPVKYTLPITFKLTPKEKKSDKAEVHNGNKDDLSLSSSGDNRLLTIVDGQVYDVDKISQIDSNKIESISVIKDDGKNEYMAKYGDKAKNGVIVVKLKK